MPRNYKNEIEWRKKKYIDITARINKELGYKFKDKLKIEHKPYAEWLRERINEYLTE